jgi:hypothetical protein
LAFGIFDDELGTLGREKMIIQILGAGRDRRIKDKAYLPPTVHMTDVIANILQEGIRSLVIQRARSARCQMLAKPSRSW